MDVWGIVAIIGGVSVAIIAVSILLKYTGVGEFIGHVLHLIGTFFQSVFSILQSITHAAPGPVKIIFFFILFVFFGAIVYNSTIGLTHACSDGKVYSMDLMTGLASLAIPKDISNSMYEQLKLERSADYGVIKSDDAGNPFLVVPDQMAPNVDAIITSSSGVGAYGNAIKAVILQKSRFEGLEYCLCVTKENVCYLSDCRYRSDSTQPEQGCTLKNSSGNVLADGSYQWQIQIAYDPNLKNALDGISYKWTSLAPGIFGWLNFFGQDFKLDKCDATGGSVYPWLASTGKLTVGYATTSSSIGEGIVFNAKEVRVVKQITNRSAFFGGWQQMGLTIDPTDPEYQTIQARAQNLDTFIEKNGELMTFGQSSVITFSCANKETNNETLLVMGIPVLSNEFMFAIIILVVFFAVIGFKKH